VIAAFAGEGQARKHSRLSRSTSRQGEGAAIVSPRGRARRVTVEHVR
jgi:hypothetical protein